VISGTVLPEDMLLRSRLELGAFRERFDTDAMERVRLCPCEFDDSGKGSTGISRGDSGEGIVRLEGRRRGGAF
jgi:hypothetical protein